ncbi:nitroreductase family protein [Clostridium chromiireducens]|uniref:Nitroreductase family protein n=1 Tax=Clostridium chromiireducens TaxID=225345 RepID=A0A1V4I6P9_9CLOT|nr:nitroreductase family protein [Clostridium chromiireducens]OPJ55668.1 nitroreductase family protein [Clostridium chromiireducens]
MANIFNKSMNEIVSKRHSVRNYENTELSNEIKEKLQAYLDEINDSGGPFGTKVRISLIQKNDANKEVKLGTYGVIKGANYYLVAVCKNGDYDFENLGFLFEKVVLYCTSLGIGTVWLGGTFSKGNFAKAVKLKEDELLPIVSPVGIEGGKKSILGALFSKKNGPKRKDFAQIFFNEKFDNPLTYEEAKEYGEVLEMVRLAPSAVNKQPWRILKEGNNYHFYSEGKSEMSRIDMGIGICHFYLTAKEKGLKGEIKVLSNKSHDKYKYVTSWIGKN